jgi:hypothetical protein
LDELKVVSKVWMKVALKAEEMVVGLVSWTVASKDENLVALMVCEMVAWMVGW